MALQKITATDPVEMAGFVIVDLDNAPAADGIVRAAKKVLQDGARTMARSRTYAWALLGEQISGASAGISVADADRAAGVAAFVEGVSDRVGSGSLSLDPGKGVTAEDLAPLSALDGRDELRNATLEGDVALADALLAAGVVAAAAAAVGGLDGRSIAIEGAGTARAALVSRFTAEGAQVVVGADGDAAPGEALEAGAEVLVCGSKLGLIDHDVAAGLEHRVVVPVGAAPVTAKGLAVAGRRDIVVLPDFLTTSGPLLAFRPAEGATAESLLEAASTHAAQLTTELLEHPEGPYLGACLRAEEFLRTWQDQLPFGRPLP